jgi:predicted transcriptional regulator
LREQRESLDAVVATGGSTAVPTNLALALNVAREALDALAKLPASDDRDRDVLLHSAREAVRGARFVLRQQQERFAATTAPAWLEQSQTSVRQLNTELEEEACTPAAVVVLDQLEPSRRKGDLERATLIAKMKDAISRMSSAPYVHHDTLSVSLEGMMTLTAGEMSNRSLHVPSIVSCSPDDTLGQALRWLTDYALEVLPVIEGQTQVGTVRADIVGSVLQEPSLLFEPVGSVMSTGDWPVLDANARMPEIVASMRGGVERALVQREQQLVGVVTAKDVRQTLSAHLLRTRGARSVDE